MERSRSHESQSACIYICTTTTTAAAAAAAAVI
jgi:hypothetical protein